MSIDWRTALDRLHHSEVSEAGRWGMSDEQANLLRDIITERVAELEAENARLAEQLADATRDLITADERADAICNAAQDVIDYDGDDAKPPFTDLLLTLEAEVSRARPAVTVNTEEEVSDSH